MAILASETSFHISPLGLYSFGIGKIGQTGTAAEISINEKREKIKRNNNVLAEFDIMF
jgi:hypothetical protein